MRKILICLFLLGLVSCSSALAQKSDLSITVKGIKDVLIAGYKASDITVAPEEYLSVVINGESTGKGNYEILDGYSLDDVKEITISFDKKNVAIYGSRARFGIIKIQLIEKKE